MTRSEVLPVPAEAQPSKNRFFDPRMPERPEQVLGLKTSAVLRLGRAALDLGALPPRVNLGLIVLPDAVRILPLIEEMQSGIELTPEDIRPYRKPIKKLSFGVSSADKLAATAGAVGIGIPLRRALNRKIEREFPGRAAEAIDSAREAVASAEEDINHLASFENPREQFVHEINELAQMTTAAITEQRNYRVQTRLPQSMERETPRGLAGFFTKVVRKVKSFFGFFSSRPKVNHEITAYDAGAGIYKTITSLRRNFENTQAQLPMLSKLVFDKLPKRLPISKDRMAMVAPEVLTFLFSTDPDNKKANSLIDSVIRNPHELRFVSHFKKRYGHYSLEGIQRASHNLLPALRDVLPTEGKKVSEIFDKLQALLEGSNRN